MTEHEKQEKQGEAELTASDLARMLAARRAIVEGTCAICGTLFKGTKKRRYCSSKCAMQAHRKGLTVPYSSNRKEQDNG